MPAVSAHREEDLIGSVTINANPEPTSVLNILRKPHKYENSQHVIVKLFNSINKDRLSTEHLRLSNKKILVIYIRTSNKQGYKARQYCWTDTVVNVHESR